MHFKVAGEVVDNLTGENFIFFLNFFNCDFSSSICSIVIFLLQLFQF